MVDDNDFDEIVKGLKRIPFFKIILAFWTLLFVVLMFIDPPNSIKEFMATISVWGIFVVVLFILRSWIKEPISKKPEKPLFNKTYLVSSVIIYLLTFYMFIIDDWRWYLSIIAATVLLFLYLRTSYFLKNQHKKVIIVDILMWSFILLIYLISLREKTNLLFLIAITYLIITKIKKLKNHNSQ